MLARIGDRVSAFFRATAPDPFVLAVVLTLATFGAALMRPGVSASGMIGAWASDAGVWFFLAFAMQMCLILVTGHILASSPPMARVLRWMAGLPRSGAQGAAMVALAAAALGVVNWGLGLIGGALLAREVGRSMSVRGVRAHYPLLAAAGYVGLLVWHGGFSGSAPITMTTEAQIVRTFGAAEAAHVAPIGLERTLLSPMNVVVTGGLVLLAPLVMGLMHPRAGQETLPAGAFGVGGDEGRDSGSAVGGARGAEGKALVPRLLEETPVVNLALAGMIGWWAWGYYVPSEDRASGLFSLTPNTMNLTMLMLGLVLHWTPSRFVAAADEAARGCAGIIIQFPLYAGIMVMMRESGLTREAAEWIARISSETTLPVLTFFSAAVVNLFVPSGGGQWGIQGPVALEAARAAGVAPERIVMAVAYGDQLTNMLQPFWALPLLAITGVKAREIVGYTAVLMALACVWVVVWLLVL